ncbi:MAG: glycosyltransferase family 2 protein [Polyangiaceae bacterium]|nr:glycosyltransferase family 2 protein [Polyangiaceae bacterium]
MLDEVARSTFPRIMAVAERCSLSIVLPCFNEAATIEAVARRAASVARGLTQRLEIIVVDDGSTDDTSAVVSVLECELPELRHVRHAENLGYGAALRAGFERSTGDLIFYTDADGQFDLDELPRLLAMLDDYDVVSGYRLSRRDGPLRYLFGVAWTALTDALLATGVRDVNCAFKVFPRSLLEPSALRSTGALLGAELLSEARRNGLRIGELGVSHHPRRAGRPTGAYPAVVGRAFRELFMLVQERAASGARSSAISTPPPVR